MVRLKPTTPEGRDRVARILMPALVRIEESGAAAIDLYVVLRATVEMLAAKAKQRGEVQALQDADRIVALELAEMILGSPNA